MQLNFGEVSVTEQVIAFQRVSISDNEPIDIVALELPEQSFVTQALWYVLPDGNFALPPDVLLGALHATEHGQIAVLPLIAMCDRWDIGGLSTNVHFQTGRSTIFIYDGHPGGVGITKRGYDEFERLLGDAERLIAECPCESGCPELRAESEVREPERTAAQGRGAGADGADARMRTVRRRRERASVSASSGPLSHEQRGGSFGAPSDAAPSASVGLGGSGVRPAAAGRRHRGGRGGGRFGDLAAGRGGRAAAGGGRRHGCLRRGGGVMAAVLAGPPAPAAR